jgi:hypothetical protein
MVEARIGKGMRRPSRPDHLPCVAHPKFAQCRHVDASNRALAGRRKRNGISPQPTSTRPCMRASAAREARAGSNCRSAAMRRGKRDARRGVVPRIGTDLTSCGVGRSWVLPQPPICQRKRSASCRDSCSRQLGHQEALRHDRPGSAGGRGAGEFTRPGRIEEKERGSTGPRRATEDERAVAES